MQRPLSQRSAGRFRRLVAVALCVQLAGCSYAFVTPPPRATTSEPTARGGCTAAVVNPTVDIALAVAAIGFGGWMFLGPLPEADEAAPVVVLNGLGGMIVGTVFATSSIYGFGATAECRERRRRFEARDQAADPIAKPRPHTEQTEEQP